MKKKWIVDLKKENTIEDCENGAEGRYSVKRVIVYCKRADVRKTVIRDKGWKITKILDWELEQTKSTAANISWLFTQGEGK